MNHPKYDCARYTHTYTHTIPRIVPENIRFVGWEEAGKLRHQPKYKKKKNETIQK